MSEIVDSEIQAVTRAKGVMASARLLIGTITQKIADAVAAALVNGATETELAPLRDLQTSLNEETDALGTAVAANP